MNRLKWLFVSVLMLGLSACQTVSNSELFMTLENGRVAVGKNVAPRLNLSSRRSAKEILKLLDENLKNPAPVIVFMHGCGGLFYETRELLQKVHELTPDFVIVAPDSFARPRPQVCGSYTVTELYATSVFWREDELDFALAELMKRPWVDKKNIFLFGHSQGGGTVFGYDGEVRIRGRVAHSGGCYDGSRTRSFTGNGTKKSHAVLAFHSTNDPWFRNNPTQCADFAQMHPNGMAITDDTPGHYRIISTSDKNAKIFRNWIYKQLMKNEAILPH